MSTNHYIKNGEASEILSKIDNESVDLILTSPPYPMIEMWDDIFNDINPKIINKLNSSPNESFEMMHLELDKTWKESFKKLKEGGHLIINIGDATRTINKNFQLFSNHSRILNKCLNLGFQNLPNIIWRKQTNAPNKFMGSGMLPPGAYVTLEHEYILIFRKGSKREFKTAEKINRSKSAYFWEERNIWFSDVWDFKGVRQMLNSEKLRKKSAAFPFELAFRIINMFSCKNDLIIDPFGGTGTSTIAAISSERNSIHIDYSKEINLHAFDYIKDSISYINSYIENRISNHYNFIAEAKRKGKDFKYYNENIEMNVTTRQELLIEVNMLNNLKLNKNNLSFEAEYVSFLDSAKQLNLKFS